MKESAIQRSPVEIWRQILQEVTYWDPIPTDDEPDLRQYSFFSEGCRKYHSYLKAVEIRGRIRLVSRSWNTIIAEMRHELVILDSSDNCWPSKKDIRRASCIEYAFNTQYCQCIGKKTRRTTRNPFGLSHPTLSSLELNQPVNAEEDWKATGSLHARVIFVEFYDDDIHQLLERSPNLQALSFVFCLGADIIKALGGGIQPTLTHLRISEIAANSMDSLGGPFRLPALKHLELDFKWKAGNHLPSPTSISSWELPVLSIFNVTGAATKGIKDGIEDLIQKCRTTIRMVVISLSWADEEESLHVWRAGPTFWDSLPHLCLFGISLEWFIEIEGVAPGPTPALPRDSQMTVYIWDFFIPYEWTDESLAGCARNLLAWCGGFSSGVKEIVMGHSWRFVAKVIGAQGTEGFAMGRYFFDEIVVGDVRFCDEKGIEIRDDEAKPFLQGLQKNKFPAGYVPRSSI